MQRWIGTPVFVLAVVFGLTFASAAEEEGFTPLFDGKTTDGWIKPYDWGKVWVNDVQTADIHDSEDAEGHIALQHHGEKGKTYQFRNVEIKILDGQEP